MEKARNDNHPAPIHRWLSKKIYIQLEYFPEPASDSEGILSGIMIMMRLGVEKTFKLSPVGQNPALEKIRWLGLGPEVERGTIVLVVVFYKGPPAENSVRSTSPWRSWEFTFLRIGDSI
jgi:hypothetical protein